MRSFFLSSTLLVIAITIAGTTTVTKPSNNTFRAVNAKVELNTIWCDNTTEHGEDEIYFLVSGKDKDGGDISYRIPGDKTHWDTNDNGNKKDQHLHANIWSQSLEEGQSAELTISVMEEDDGQAGKALEIAAEAARQTDKDDTTDGTLASIVQLIGSIMAQNTDDFPGSFNVRVSNIQGNLVTTVSAGERCRYDGANNLGHDSGQHGAHIIRLSGDGSTYTLYVDVK